MRDGALRGLLFGLLAGLLLCFCLAARAAEKVRTVVIFKGKLGAYTLAQPVFAPRFLLERIRGKADPKRGTSSECRAFIRTLRMIEMDGSRGVVQDMALDCDGTLFVVRGLLLDPLRD